MPEKWTGDIVALLHLHGITRIELAEKLGQHPKYVLAVLNGKRAPEGAEEKFRAAVDELIKEKEAQLLEAGT